MFAIDVSSVDQIEALMASVDADHGKIDVLYAHAGIPGASGLDISEADYDHAAAINMKSAFFTVGRAVPLLEASGNASIIMTASHLGVGRLAVLAASTRSPRARSSPSASPSRWRSPQTFGAT